MSLGIFTTLPQISRYNVEWHNEENQNAKIKMAIQNVKLNTRNISRNDSFGRLHYIMISDF